jgi:hypothetical protein
MAMRRMNVLQAGGGIATEMIASKVRRILKGSESPQGVIATN